MKNNNNNKILNINKLLHNLSHQLLIEQFLNEIIRKNDYNILQFKNITY